MSNTVSTTAIDKVVVDLGERSYDISIGAGLLKNTQWLDGVFSDRQLFLVTNQTIAELYLADLETALSGRVLGQVVLPDGEQYKNLATMGLIYDALLTAKANRDITLVALGGGVIGDMTGFAAATYQRGVDFIQIPTTLLAQVDSSVGGKTGVNHAAGKNMVGAFHQPQSVIIDTQSLVTLPKRELIAGLAEVIKYGLIADREFLDWLQQNMGSLLARDPSALQFAISRSCQNKARVVALDEKESGIRATLNLGHTFGHAIETAMSYSNWLHGEAVGIGMIIAADFSYRLGLLSEDDFSYARSIILDAGLPATIPDGLMSVSEMLSLMSVDKKVKRGQLRLVLLKQLGEAYLDADFSMDLLRATLADYLK